MDATANAITIGRDAAGKSCSLIPSMANRHGLIAGATGTGKTVTLQLLAEGFSSIGVPVFTADVKGDLSGIAAAGALTPKLQERLAAAGFAAPAFAPSPVLFWDLYGANGHPVHTTLGDVGPLLLSRMLDLNETQAQVLQLAFTIADNEGLLLLDTKDLRALLGWIGEHASELRTEYGNFAPATIGAIQRALLALDEAGGSILFGEPALQLPHLLQRDFSGRGVINILDAARLLHDARLYSTFLLWLLSELFEELDEVGDADKPRLVFFFDEAHLLFKDTPRVLLEKIEQVVRLIRSKGVGVFFVTQNPLDIPPPILGQLGNRVQHALRAFTPADQKAVRAAAQTLRANPALDTAEAITQLGVGEALVSTLDAEGRPAPVERVMIAPPAGKIGPLDPAVRGELTARSPLAGVYDMMLDRESAFELLQKRRAERPAAEAGTTRREDSIWDSIFKSSSRRQSPAEAFVKSTLRSVGSAVGREIVRGVLGSLSRRR